MAKVKHKPPSRSKPATKPVPKAAKAKKGKTKLDKIVDALGAEKTVEKQAKPTTKAANGAKPSKPVPVVSTSKLKANFPKKAVLHVSGNHSNSSSRIYHDIHRIHQWVDAEFAANMGTGTHTLTLPQFEIMRVLCKSEAGMSQREITEKTCIDRSTIAEIMRRLVNREYVLRVDDPADSRAYIITATERGAQLCVQASKVMAQIERQLVAWGYEQRVSDALTSIVSKIPLPANVYTPKPKNETDSNGDTEDKEAAQAKPKEPKSKRETKATEAVDDGDTNDANAADREPAGDEETVSA